MPIVGRVDHTTMDEQLNLWCGQCLLPSAYDCTYAVTVNGSPCGLIHITGCVNECANGD